MVEIRWLEDPTRTAEENMELVRGARACVAELEADHMSLTSRAECRTTNSTEL